MRAGARRYARLYGPGLGCGIANAESHSQSIRASRFRLKDYSHRVVGNRGTSLMNIEDSDLTILSLRSFSGAGTETPRLEGLPTYRQSIFGSLLSIVSSRPHPEAVVDAPTSRLKTMGGGHA